MAQNESRYAVLRDLIYPKSYFEGVSDGTMIKGWSPNNLRRIFLFTNRVYVQWYVNCNKLEGKNPFLIFVTSSDKDVSLINFIRYHLN